MSIEIKKFAKFGLGQFSNLLIVATLVSWGSLSSVYAGGDSDKEGGWDMNDLMIQETHRILQETREENRNAELLEALLREEGNSEKIGLLLGGAAKKAFKNSQVQVNVVAQAAKLEKAVAMAPVQTDSPSIYNGKGKYIEGVGFSSSSDHSSSSTSGPAK